MKRSSRPLTLEKTDHFERVKERYKKALPYILHLVLVAVAALYVVAGAAAIRRIEAVWVQRNEKKTIIEASNANEMSALLQSQRAKECVIEILQEMSDVYKCTQNEIDEMAVTVYNNCFRQQITIHPKETDTLDYAFLKNTSDFNDFDYLQWSFMDSVVFCFTVITTIGYGNVAPKTVEGRLFVIAYGIFGIPFTMIAIASLGKFLAGMLENTAKILMKLVRTIIRKCCSSRKILKEKESLVKNGSIEERICEENNVFDENSDEEKMDTWNEALILFIAFFIYIICGSMLIASYEPEMELFDAIYFNFVSLTTIGLGDLVPKNETFLVLTLVYSAIGLALTTIAIEIAAEYLKMLHYFGREIKNVGSVRIWFGGKKLTMKQLVRNLGDQFNLSVHEVADLNLDEFVDAAIKVEAGEMPSLRSPRPIIVDIESIAFVDADESLSGSNVRDPHSLSLHDYPTR